MKIKKSCKVLSVRELMEEMGFNKKALASTQEAFLRYIERSLGKNVVSIRKVREEKNREKEPEQLDLFKKAA